MFPSFDECILYTLAHADGRSVRTYALVDAAGNPVSSPDFDKALSLRDDHGFVVTERALGFRITYKNKMYFVQPEAGILVGDKLLAAAGAQ